MTGKHPPGFNAKAFFSRPGEGKSRGKYTAAQAIFSQGDPADAVFYIQKGEVKISVVSEMGKEAVVALLRPKAFFGEGALAGQASRISTATSLSDSVIYRIEKPVVIGLIKEDAAFSDVFVAHLLGRAIRVEADLIDQLFNSSEKRLARLLADQVVTRLLALDPATLP